MNDCSIREAQLKDAPAIARLVTQLGYPTSSAEMEMRLQIFLARADYITLVAEVSGDVVALVGAYLAYGLELTGTYGRLTGLVVDEPWRGRGIGKLLMEHLEQRLKKKGVMLLILTSGKHRTESHHFYKKLGYEETGIRFLKRLS